MVWLARKTIEGVRKSLLFTVFVVLNAFDCFTTYIILEGGGKEISPIMNYVIEKFSYAGMVAVKAVVLAFMFRFLNFFSKGGLTTLNIVFVLMVIHNLVWIFLTL